jgi:hypothetical protein
MEFEMTINFGFGESIEISTDSFWKIAMLSKFVRFLDNAEEEFDEEFDEELEEELEEDESEEEYEYDEEGVAYWLDKENDVWYWYDEESDDWYECEEEEEIAE